MTLKELAALSGVSVTTLRRMETRPDLRFDRKTVRKVVDVINRCLPPGSTPLTPDDLIRQVPTDLIQ